MLRGIFICRLPHVIANSEWEGCLKGLNFKGKYKLKVNWNFQKCVCVRGGGCFNAKKNPWGVWKFLGATHFVIAHVCDESVCDESAMKVYTM